MMTELRLQWSMGCTPNMATTSWLIVIFGEAC
jgi:hypothetical protein